jgi:hypothetical protein
MRKLTSFERRLYWDRCWRVFTVTVWLVIAYLILHCRGMWLWK